MESVSNKVLTRMIFYDVGYRAPYMQYIRNIISLHEEINKSLDTKKILLEAMFKYDNILYNIYQEIDMLLQLIGSIHISKIDDCLLRELDITNNKDYSIESLCEVVANGDMNDKEDVNLCIGRLRQIIYHYDLDLYEKYFDDVGLFE